MTEQAETPAPSERINREDRMARLAFKEMLRYVTNWFWSDPIILLSITTTFQVHAAKQCVSLMTRYADNMIPLAEPDDAMDGAVTIAVFNRVPSGGWLLYFSGIKRATIASRFHRSKPEAEELVAEAVTRLAGVAHSEGLRLMVHVTGAKIGNEKLLEILSAHPHLIHSPEPVGSADSDLLGYLFSTAPTKKKVGEAKKMHSKPLYEAAEPGKAVVTADASYMALGRGAITAPLGGTGWAVGFHLPDSAPEVVLGSKSYLPEPEHCSANAMELYALRDAMEAAAGLESMRLHNSVIVVYSDSNYAVTAVQKRKAIDSLAPVLESILAHVAELSRDGIDVRFQWTKGHSSNGWNTLAHRMAALGRRGDDHTEGDVAQAVLMLSRRNLL